MSLIYFVSPVLFRAYFSSQNNLIDKRNTAAEKHIVVRVGSTGEKLLPTIALWQWIAVTGT